MSFTYTVPIRNPTTKNVSDITSKVVAASAVDTGLFKRSWNVSIVPNGVKVTNSSKYAIYIEFGTVMSKKHQFKIRRAIESLGFSTSSVSVTGANVTLPSGEQATPSDIPEESIRLFTLKDVISLRQFKRPPSRISQINKNKVNFIKNRRPRKIISKAALLIGAALILSREENNEQISR